MNKYGNQCKCCGESRIEFLTIEHSFNNGAEHKRKIGNGTVYRDLKKRGFPKDEGYIVLCYNCNMSRGHCGYCPHEKEDISIVTQVNYFLDYERLSNKNKDERFIAN